MKNVFAHTEHEKYVCLILYRIHIRKAFISVASSLICYVLDGWFIVIVPVCSMANVSYDCNGSIRIWLPSARKFWKWNQIWLNMFWRIIFALLREFICCLFFDLQCVSLMVNVRFDCNGSIWTWLHSGWKFWNVQIYLLEHVSMDNFCSPDLCFIVVYSCMMIIVVWSRVYSMYQESPVNVWVVSHQQSVTHTIELHCTPLVGYHQHVGGLGYMHQLESILSM